MLVLEIATRVMIPAGAFDRTIRIQPSLSFTSIFTLSPRGSPSSLLVDIFHIILSAGIRLPSLSTAQNSVWEYIPGTGICISSGSLRDYQGGRNTVQVYYSSLLVSPGNSL